MLKNCPKKIKNARKKMKTSNIGQGNFITLKKYQKENGIIKNCEKHVW